MIPLPDPTSLGIFLLAALVLLLTPGPAVLYIVACSIDQRRRAGLVSMLGVHAGTLVHISAAAVGMSAVLEASATAFSAVKLLGAGYLVYLGLGRIVQRSTVPGIGAARRPRLRRAFLDGVVVNVLNPKMALFFLAFIPQFVDASRGHVGAQVLALAMLFVVLGVITDAATGRPGPPTNRGERSLDLRRDVHRPRSGGRALERPPAARRAALMRNRSVTGSRCSSRRGGRSAARCCGVIWLEECGRMGSTPATP